MSFFGYNSEPTNFFPDLPPASSFLFSDFKKLNEKQFGKKAVTMRFNGSDPAQGDVNIRSKEFAKPEDCADGLQCRNLWNWNHLIAKVNVKD